jgi:hypothetical protein
MNNITLPMNRKENAAAVEGLLNALAILKQVRPHLTDVPGGMENGMTGVNSSIREIQDQIAHIISVDLTQRIIVTR